MANLFNSIELQKPRKNVFDLSHDVKLSLNMGDLVPIMCLETIPGDKFNLSCESLLRFAPLVSPVMHRMDVTMHYFFVPNRILWPGWEKFITNDPSFPGFPNVLADDLSGNYGLLMDYLGVPTPVPAAPGESINAMPFAAYQMVYNEYYRDQNLVPPVNFQLVNGDNNANADLFILRKRAWEHDYFTAALPFAQKGAAVTLPIGNFIDVGVNINQDVNPGASGQLTDAVNPGPVAVSVGVPAGSPLPANPGMYAKTSDLVAQASTINDLRRAYRLQEWLEKAARGGSRLKETILNHFGVRTSDSRLQRPEYITGTKSPVMISEVLNTSDTATAPQGNMAGHGVSVTSGKYGHYFCEEHGYIIGIMSVMPKTAYQQGLEKHFLKTSDPFQYFWPAFANIGEQEVLNREIYAYQGTAGGDTFGYVPRYAEYKFANSRVAGDFRSSLDFWHLGRKFATPPALNQTFIEVDSATTDRVFAVTTPGVQKLYCHVLNKVQAVRCMPKFGTPTF